MRAWILSLVPVLLGMPLLLDAAETLAVKAEHCLLDPRQELRGPCVVVVQGERIVRVLEGADPRFTDEERAGGVREVDLGALTLLPGLVDAHVHLSVNPGRPWWARAVQTAESATVIAVQNAAKTVRAGFTTVRDLGAPGQSAHAVRDAIARGEIPGPRMLIAGQMISIIGGHADASGFRPEINAALDAGNTCTGPVECAEVVRRLSRNGADLIKFAATGGVLSEQNRGLDQHFTDEEMRAIVATAHVLNLKVSAHAHGPRGIEAAASAGVDSIDHGTFIDAAGVRAMKAAGSYLVPTLSTTLSYRDRIGRGIYTEVVEAKIRQRMAVTGKNIQAARAAGIPIAFGTDAGVAEHGENAKEFRLMLEAGGMSSREALLAATVHAAELLGLGDRIGVLAAGRAADLIAVAGDPLADVTVLERVEFVLAAGRIVRMPGESP